MKRALQVVLMVMLVSGLIWAGLNRSGTVSAIDVVAVPVAGQEGDLRLFMTLINDGDADQLLSVTAPDADSGEIIAPDGIAALSVPSESKAILSADGAHLRLGNVRGAVAEGRLLPIELRFASGHIERAQARVAAAITPGDAADAGIFSLGAICRTGDGEPAPQITASVSADGDGWLLTLKTEDFTFTEPVESLGHVPGYGHGHVYLNGLKLGRMYAPETRISALPPGEHILSVTLYTNDHRAYVIDDKVAEARVSITVD